MARSINVIILFPKSASDAERANVKQEVEAAIAAKMNGAPFKVVTSAEAWEKAGAQAGGWGGWVRYVASGCDSITGNPNFDVFVLPWLSEFGPGRIGKITAQILNANNGAKKVRAFSQGQLYEVVGMDELNPHDFKSGWKIQVPALE